MFHRLGISEVFLAFGILQCHFILLSYLPFLYLPSCPLYLFLHARKELSHGTAPPAPWLNDIFKICRFIRMHVVSSYVKEDTSVSWPTWCQGWLQVTTWDQWSVHKFYLCKFRKAHSHGLTRFCLFSALRNAQSSHASFPLSWVHTGGKKSWREQFFCRPIGAGWTLQRPYLVWVGIGVATVDWWHRLIWAFSLVRKSHFCFLLLFLTFPKSDKPVFA